MDLCEVIRSTRVMRRLDPGREVPDTDFQTIIAAATKAANGGSRQQVRGLAARALGLGTTLPARHRRREAEEKASLGLPDDVHAFAMIPAGYPLGRWGEAPRGPARVFAVWDRRGATAADGDNDHV